jgi:ComF family protein
VQLPITNYHQYPDNPVAKMFWGRSHVLHASSYLYFVKGGRVQQLLHRLKYQKARDVGFFLGQLYAQQLGEHQVATADYIIPVPMHPSKQRKRGYNQSAIIAQGMAHIWGMPMTEEVLIKVRKTNSQTRLDRWSRWTNQQEIFIITEAQSLLKNKHVVLVDDVITTGSTLEACISLLSLIEGCEVSVLTLAVAT